jgi:hypothetical protein
VGRQHKQERAAQGGGVHLFTAMPRRLVFSKTGLLVYGVLGDWAQ